MKKGEHKSELEEVKRDGQKKRGLFYLTKQYKNKWWAIIIAIVLTVYASSVSGKIPDETSKLFDGAFSSAQLLYVIKLTLISAAVSFAASMLNAYAMSYGIKSLQASVWKKMMRVGIGYYDENDPTKQASLLTNDAEVGGWIPQVMSYIPSMATLIVTSLLMLKSYNPKLLLILILIVPLNIVYIVLVGVWQENLSTRSTLKVGNLTGYLSERIRNLAMIKVFTAEERERRNGKKVITDIYEIGKETSILAAVIVNFAKVNTVIATVATVIWGCHLLRNGEINQMQFIAFSGYVPIISLCFSMLSIVWTFIKGFAGMTHRMNKLFLTEDEQKDASGETETASGDLKFEHVTFKYLKADEVTLKDMSFSIPEKKVTAIVGPSGSGKSTVIKLIEKLYKPQEGSITVGGENLTDVNINTWRSEIAFVAQDSGLFSGTIREALTYGVKRELTEEDIQKVIEKVDLKDFVASLPDGLETKLENWGSSLSGGQRQRIAIGRALLKDASVLIFDEPTSALDPDAANGISELIFHQFKDKTIVIITHELGYIANADHIIVISDGKVEGEGDHGTLMTTCKVYRDLVEEQSYKEVFE